MELGLELYSGEVIESFSRRFYPCFNGIRVGTKGYAAYIRSGNRVSILVLMELGLERRKGNASVND